MDEAELERLRSRDPDSYLVYTPKVNLLPLGSKLDDVVQAHPGMLVVRTEEWYVEMWVPKGIDPCAFVVEKGPSKATKYDVLYIGAKVNGKAPLPEDAAVRFYFAKTQYGRMSHDWTVAALPPLNEVPEPMPAMTTTTTVDFSGEEVPLPPPVTPKRWCVIL